MSAPVQRLQALLQTVQRNRQKPRTPGGAGNGHAFEEERSTHEMVSLVPDPRSAPPPPRSPVQASPTAPPPAPEPSAPAMPRPEPSAPAMPRPEPHTEPMPAVAPASGAPSKRRGQASPLMAALDDKLSQTQPPAPLATSAAGSAPGATPTGAPSSQAAPGNRPHEIEGTPMRAPNKPIVSAVSPAPARDEPTFGELLTRSLSLRPR